jgi:CheY-like chemotaxis protein
LKTALARRPWLILTEVNLPILDGFEFCRRVRSHSLLRHTPLVFLSAWDEYRERYHGLSLGADDYLSKQTDARELLIRLQIILKRFAEVGVRSRKGAAMEGGIELIGAPGMLQMCHLSRFTGVLTVRSGSGRVQIRLRDGELLSAESNEAKGAEAIFEFLTWSRGHFEFVPGDPGEGEPLPEKFDYLLLEGCRRLDESLRDVELRSVGGGAAPES